MEKEISFVVDKELFNAIKQGDIEKVNIALESGVSPDAHLSLDGETKPLLSIAAEVYIYLFIFNNADKCLPYAHIEWSFECGQVFD